MCNTPNTDPYGNVIRDCYCGESKLGTWNEAMDAAIETYNEWIDDENAMSDFGDILSRMKR